MYNENYSFLTVGGLINSLLDKLNFSASYLLAALIADTAGYQDLFTRAKCTPLNTCSGKKLARWTTHKT